MWAVRRPGVRAIRAADCTEHLLYAEPQLRMRGCRRRQALEEELFCLREAEKAA